jgi:hypothetical protein
MTWTPTVWQSESPHRNGKCLDGIIDPEFMTVAEIEMCCGPCRRTFRERQTPKAGPERGPESSTQGDTR